MKREHKGQRSVYEEYLELDEVGPNSPSPEGGFGPQGGGRPWGERRSPLRFDRRQFLQLVGGGIVVCFSIPDSLALQERERRPGMGQELPEDFNAFLRIGEDGRVTGFTGKVEYGQGVITSLAQMLAEELDVPLKSVDMVMGDTDLCPWDRGTFGSMTTRFFGPAFRAAAAEARAVLIELAAEQLQVTKDRLKTKAGVVYEVAGQKKVSYAELAQGQKILRHVKGVAPKSPSDFVLIGKHVLRRDAAAKVTGQAIYAGDVREPGLLHARILRPPVHGAKLIQADTSGAKEIEGVQIVEEGDLIAVLHPYPDLAEKALANIKAQYDRPAPTVDDKTIFDHLLKVAPKGETVAEGGILSEGRKCSSRCARANVPEQLRLSRPHRNAHRFGQDRRKQGDPLGLHANALRPERRGSLSSRPACAECAGHHTLYRRGLRRKEQQSASPRGGQAGQADRKTNTGSLDSGRGVLL